MDLARLAIKTATPNVELSWQNVQKRRLSTFVTFCFSHAPWCFSLGIFYWCLKIFDSLQEFAPFFLKTANFLRGCKECHSNSSFLRKWDTRYTGSWSGGNVINIGSTVVCITSCLTSHNTQLPIYSTSHFCGCISTSVALGSAARCKCFTKMHRCLPSRPRRRQGSRRSTQKI